MKSLTTESVWVYRIWQKMPVVWFFYTLSPVFYLTFPKEYNEGNQKFIFMFFIRSVI